MKALYSEELDIVQGAIEELWSDDLSTKQRLVNVWKRNAYFVNGIQSVQYGDNTAQEVGDQLIISRFQNPRFNMYITNEIEPIVRTLASYMTRARPAVDAFAADKSSRSKLSSDLAKQVLDAKYDLDKESANSRDAAYWAMVTGTVFRKDYWDYSLGTTIQIPQYDELGNPMVDPETGFPLISDQKVGDNNIAILTGFSMSFDWSATSFDELSWIGESYLAPVEWVHESFMQDGEGFTGRAEEVEADGQIGNSLESLEELKFAVPGIRTPATKGVQIDKVLVREWYMKPNREWPEGRLVILAGKEIVFDGPSPYFFHNMEGGWHPYTCWNFEPFIGRLFGKSLIESLIPLQMRLNEINGAILENANTMAKPDWLIPDEAQLKMGVLTGGGGRIYRCKSHGLGFQPQRLQGVPLPAQFFNERQILIDEMVRIAGTNFVMSGQAPQGVTAAAAIDMLLQNASSQQSDVMVSWEKFHEQAYTKKLNVIKKFSQFPNQRLTDYLRAVTGDALQIEIEAFTGSEIADGVTLRIEAGSMIPKQEKAKQDAMKELLKQGALGPVAEDSPRGAVLRAKIQKELGVYDLDIEDEKDVEKAKWENARIQSDQMPDPQEIDNHAIHIYLHSGQFKDPLFIERASPEKKQLLMQHIQFHQQQMQLQQQQAQQQQMQLQQQALQDQAAAQIQVESAKALAKEAPQPQEELPASEEELPPEMLQ